MFYNVFVGKHVLRPIIYVLHGDTLIEEMPGQQSWLNVKQYTK